MFTFSNEFVREGKRYAVYRSRPIKVSEAQNRIFSAEIQFDRIVRIADVQVSNGWDIAYVQCANLILTAFRVSPHPLLGPANRTLIHIEPPHWGEVRKGDKTSHGRIPASDDTIIIITVEVFEGEI